MSELFFNNIYFDRNISRWNVGNVTDMSHMFFNAENFNQSLMWDVSNANIKDMFNGTKLKNDF